MRARRGHQRRPRQHETVLEQDHLVVCHNRLISNTKRACSDCRWGTGHPALPPRAAAMVVCRGSGPARAHSGPAWICIDESRESDRSRRCGRQGESVGCLRLRDGPGPWKQGQDFPPPSGSRGVLCSGARGLVMDARSVVARRRAGGRGGWRGARDPRPAVSGPESRAQRRTRSAHGARASGRRGGRTNPVPQCARGVPEAQVHAVSGGSGSGASCRG